MLPFKKYSFFRLLLTCFLFAFHRIHDFTNYLHNIDMYLFCMGAIHRGAIYSNIVINSPAFLFIYAICNHFGDFYFLHGIGIGVFPPFSIQ